MSDDVLLPTAIPIAAIFVVLIFLACFKFWLDQNRKRRADDTESLYPTSDHHSCWGQFCSETVPDNDRREVARPVEQQPSNSSPLRVIVRNDAAGANHQPNSSSSRNQCQQQQRVIPSGTRSALGFLQDIQSQAESKDEIVEAIRLAQNMIVLQGPPPTESSLQTTLVIGVDATPAVFGGYCVNLQVMSIEYYVIKVDDFPWEIQNRSHPDEFEMKNLQFALAVWSKSIRKYKKFRIYTDNNAITSDENAFGSDANELLDHFTECEDADLVNGTAFVNRKQKLESFAKYIQPADDFSRFEIEKGIDFLCQYYGIRRQNVRGTHKLTKPATEETRAWYQSTDFYTQKIQRATAFGNSFKCENCNVSLFGSQRPSRQRKRTKNRHRSRSRY